MYEAFQHGAPATDVGCLERPPPALGGSGRGSTPGAVGTNGGVRDGRRRQVQYFYKIRWGFQDEFVELFERNHWPLLKAQLESGRLLDVRAYEPRFHGDGRQDWTFEVTITYRDWPSMEEHTDPAIVRRLYPDAERLKREEQRRFELIEAHWDTPLEEHALPR